MNKEDKKLIPVIIWIGFGPILVLLFVFWGTIFHSQFISWQVGQNVYCTTSKIPGHYGCWNIDEKITWSNYKNVELDFNDQNKNIPASGKLETISWIEVISFLGLIGVFGIYYKTKAKK